MPLIVSLYPYKDFTVTPRTKMFGKMFFSYFEQQFKQR